MTATAELTELQKAQLDVVFGFIYALLITQHNQYLQQYANVPENQRPPFIPHADSAIAQLSTITQVAQAFNDNPVFTIPSMPDRAIMIMHELLDPGYQMPVSEAAPAAGIIAIQEFHRNNTPSNRLS